MNEGRLQKVLEEMKRSGMEQMVVTNPYSIYYLAGHFEKPLERFWALYVSEKRCCLIANRLFTVRNTGDTEILWYSDGEDGAELLSTVVDHEKKLGVDDNMMARFLLRLMELEAAPSYCAASFCLDTVRAHKDEEEVVKMRYASELNDAAMAKFKELIRPGVTEKEIADQILAIYRDLGADDNSFTPIVAFGGNAASGHHDPDNTVLKEGDCIVLDVGCLVNRYCSDMTRTFFFGEPTEERKKVYETVLKAQLAAEAAIRPGVALKDIDSTARDIITEAGYGPYFTHRLGHFIGQEVHEKGDVSQSSELIAEPGMIFSIEPGIYLPGNVGVRIEDLVLVTEDGIEILNHYTKELQIIGA